MTAISGRNGKVTFNDGSLKTLGQCTEWDLEIQTDTEDIAIFGNNGWKDKMYMMSSWSGSLNCKWDMTDAGQSALQAKILTPASITLNLIVDNSGGDTHKLYSGTAYIKSISIKTPANGIVEADIQFEGTGALTYTA